MDLKGLSDLIDKRRAARLSAVRKKRHPAPDPIPARQEVAPEGPKAVEIPEEVPTPEVPEVPETPAMEVPEEAAPEVPETPVIEESAGEPEVQDQPKASKKKKDKKRKKADTEE